MRWLSLLLVCCTGRLQAPPQGPLEFPRDHGFHAEAQTEWWYLQGMLRDGEGGELAVFLSSVLHDPRLDRVLGLPVLSLGQRLGLFTACVADLDRGVPVSERRTVARFPGLFQWIDAEGGDFQLRVRRWHTRRKDGVFAWEVPVDGGMLRLEAAATADPLPISEAGQGDALGRLSLGTSAFSYYAHGRVQLRGSLEEGGQIRSLEGTGWLDHQWGFVYAREYGGWSWFALNLDDGTDLLLSRVEPRNAGVPAAIVGTLRPPGGAARAVGPFELEVLERGPPVRGESYPSRVRLALPEEELELEVAALLPESEWRMVPVPIWEGPVSVRGRWRGRTVGGAGYAEHLQRGDPPARRLYHSGRPLEH